jgi:hypothetical protein
LALLLRRQYEFPQGGINKGNIYVFLFTMFALSTSEYQVCICISKYHVCT